MRLAAEYSIAGVNCALAEFGWPGVEPVGDSLPSEFVEHRGGLGVENHRKRVNRVLRRQLDRHELDPQIGEHAQFRPIGGRRVVFDIADLQ